MARVLLYERAVDAICTNTHIDLTCDEKTQNGVKIKEEIEEDPVDATLNINTTKNCVLVKNCSNLIRSKSSLSENNIAQKNNNINSNENELAANSHSAYLDDINKAINLKRKIVEATEEHDASSQPKKKRQSSNEISKIGNTSDATEFKCYSTSYGRRFSKKRKLQNIAKKKKKLNHIKCDICFRRFTSIIACEQHKWYYDNIFKCNLCKKQYKTRAMLQMHIISSHSRNNYKSSHLLCNFCNRNFTEKPLLQSHLFHTHNELIYSSNKVKQLNSRSKNHASTPQKSTTLKTDTHEEHSNNPVKSEELNIKLINDASKFGNNDLIKTKESETEVNEETESSSHEILSTNKRLRQPTLTEYLELYKKKCDKHSPNKLNMKNDSPMFALHCDRQVEESLNSGLSKDVKAESLSVESSNIPKRMTRSVAEQNEKDDVCVYLAKKPFVKIHADVEMMKAFLDNLSDTVTKEDVNIDDTNKSSLSYRELPYSLRKSRVIPFIQTSLRSRNKSKNVFKTQSNARHNTETEQNVNDLDFWKTSMVRFKFKDCIIPLTRCDENPKNNQISTNNATFKTNASLTIQRKSTSFQENNIRNKTMLKELVIPLERLENFPTVDITKEAILDTKKPNDDCFLCKICNESFSSKLAKQMHIKSRHIAYMSSICNARYKQKNKLCEHYLQEHLFKLNQCCICYMILPNFTTLLKHLNIHCIKYVQRKNDQYPIDKEIQCNKNKKVNKYSHYNKEFSLSTLISHESHCVVQKKTEEEKNNSLKETSTSENHKFSDIVLKKHHNENADEILVVCDEKIHSTVSCENPNNDSAEKSNKHQTSVIDENPVVANDLLVTEGIGTSNESQDSKTLPENNNSIINDKDTVKAQLDVVESDIKIELCIICGKQFHSRTKLEHHMRIFSHITDICSICGTGFGSRRFLQTHITAAHVPQFSKGYTFHCMFCNQGFFKKIELRSHVLHLHGQEMLNSLTQDFQPNQEKSDKLNTTKCNVCHLVYESHDRYTEHMMYYYKNHVFTCSICKKSFRGMYLFHNHYKLTHYSEDIRKSYSYICEICNEGFKHESHFYSHKMHVHLNEESSTEIAKGFKEGNQFDHTSKFQQQKREFFTNLQKQIEQSSYKYICQICQMKYPNANYLMAHVACYSNDGSFQCNNCNRRCRTSALLEQHTKLTHTYRDIYNGHACSICGEVLETSLSLKCHEKHFHSNNVNNADVCENCGQTLSSNIARKKHRCKSSNVPNLQLVEDNDRYDCLFCDMNFFDASAAKMHITQVHIDKLLAKHSASKPSTVDNIQEQSVQYSEASSSENSQSQLHQQSIKIQNSNWIKYMKNEKKKKMAIESSSQVKTNKLKTISSESSNEVKTVLPELSNQVKTVLLEPSNQVKTNKLQTISSESSNKVKTVLLPESSNRVKTVLLELSKLNHQVKTALSEPSSQVKTILPESSNQGKTVLPESSNQVKIVLPESSNQVKTVITEPSNEAETILFNNILHQVRIMKPSNNDKIIQQKILYHASPHINGSEVQINTSMATAPNNVFKTITTDSVPTGLTNSLSKSNISSNSESANVFQANQTSSLNESSNKSITLPSTSNELLKVGSLNLKTNEIVNNRLEAVKSDYTCPLCPLVYPSLVFFHAHLKYAHATSICKDPVYVQNYLSNPKFPIIKCLLCSSSIFTDEEKYKKHLKNFHTHYVYIPRFEENKDIDNTSNIIAQTNDNRKSITPEVITLDDDDSIENDSDKRTAEADAIPITRPCKEQNDNKIGKLRVKSFAKIVGNLSMDSLQLT